MSRVQIALLLALLLGVLGLAALAVRSSQQTHNPSYGERTEEAEKGDHGKEDRKSFWERTTDDPVAAFTAALVLFTAVLAGVSMIQVRFLIRADETARIAATAAKRSADAVRSIERPWMVATADEVSLCDGIEAAVEGDPFTFKVPIKFVNEGRTSAFLEGFYAVSTIAAYPGPAIRNVRLKQTEGWDIKINMEGKSVGPGGQEAFDLGFGLVIHSEAAITILEGDAVIWLYGYLEYTDFLMEERQTYFCFSHNMGIGCVTPFGGKKDNYMT